MPYHVVNKDVFEGTRLIWQEEVRRGYKRIGGAMFRHSPIAEDDFPRYGASLSQHDGSSASRRPRRRLVG